MLTKKLKRRLESFSLATSSLFIGLFKAFLLISYPESFCVFTLINTFRIPWEPAPIFRRFG